MENKKHSAIGGSSLYRISKCPGSRALSETIPREEEESEYARKGTEAHARAEYELTLGECGKTEYNILFDTEETDSVNTYVEYVNSIAGELFIESKIDLTYIHPDAFGTADAIIWNEEEKILHVIDYKHGAGLFVPVVDNMQAQFYALGAIKNFKPEKIIITIVQPRCQTNPADNDADEVSDKNNGIRSWEIHPLHLFEFEQELKEIYKRAFEVDAPYIPGEHCRFCAGNQVDGQGDYKCPELKKQQKEILVTAFKEIELEPNPEQLSKYLDMCTQAEAWIKQLRQKAFAKLNNGEDVPGYKLVQKRAIRKWLPEAEAILKDAWDDIYEPKKLKSPAQMERGRSKTEKEALNELIISESSGVTMTEISDKRKTVQQGSFFYQLEMDLDT